MEKNNISFLAKTIKFFMKRFKLTPNIMKNILNNKINQKFILPPKKFYKKYNVVQYFYNNQNYIKFGRNEDLSNTVLIYLHGGAYIYNISSFHWNMLWEISKHVNSIFYVLDYPLAPKNNYTNTLKWIDKIYKDIANKYPEKEIILMGDSAGGGLSLGYWLSIRSNTKNINPKKLILLSPWLDISMTNPDINNIKDKDYILDKKGLQFAGIKYAGSKNLKDPLVSPIYGDLKNIPKTALFIGTHDILYPDALKLKNILKKNSNFFFYPYKEMFHVWMGITSLPESKDALNKIIKFIKMDH